MQFSPQYVVSPSAVTLFKTFLDTYLNLSDIAMSSLLNSKCCEPTEGLFPPLGDDLQGPVWSPATSAAPFPASFCPGPLSAPATGLRPPQG